MIINPSVNGKKFMTKIILLILFTGIVFCQTTDTTRIFGDSLNSKNIQIFENWDYHPGDDSAWALPAFSSVGWKTVNCKLDLDSIKAYEWNGIGWLRKTIVIDSSLMNKTLAMTLNHYGASQFYIDGKLINNFGTVSKQSDGEKIYYSNSEPIIINFNSNSTYLLAVRYSNHLPLDYPYLYKIFRNNIGFYATFKTWTKGINFYGVTQANDSVLYAWLTGILLSISVIYFLLFLFYSKQKEYLYYTIFTFAFTLVFATSLFDNIVYSGILYFFSFEIISRITLFAVFLGVLAFLYQIFYGRMLKLFPYFLTFGVGIFILGMIITSDRATIRIAVLAFVFITSIEILRVLFLAIKRKKNNAWVIGMGVSVFTVGILSTIIYGLAGGQVNSIYVIFILLFSIPLSMSVYLARSSSQTNKNLETQLATVKLLSEEAIEKEKTAAKLTIETQLVKAENERKTKELEDARQLQLSMLPKELPKLPHLDIAVYMKTATEVGGDYYDFNVDINGTLTVLVGDATGHGMMSGMMVSIMKSFFISNKSNIELKTFFENANNSIKDMHLGRLMMACMGVQITSEKIIATNAGMPSLIYFRNKSQKAGEFVSNNLPLGGMKETNYSLKKIKYEKDDTLLLMSDGFAELKNENNEQYGYPRIIKEFKSVVQKGSNEIVEHLNNSASEWTKGNEPDDDITFVVIKVK
jgi:serine phosphatase RsbU (regulator of sigma subunit)